MSTRRSGLPAAMFTTRSSQPGGRSYVRKIRGLLVVMLFSSLAAANADERLERSRTIAQEFQQSLGAELQAALRTGGPVEAIRVCAEEAPGIAARASAESGAAVSRTALRVRNPGNSADAAAQRVLESFADRLAAGDVPPLEHFAPGPQGGMRYMQAIVLQPLCVSCHGQALAPDVAAAITQRYPSDRATGFRVGELRGAFLIDWPAATEATP